MGQTIYIENLTGKELSFSYIFVYKNKNIVFSNTKKMVYFSKLVRTYLKCWINIILKSFILKTSVSNRSMSILIGSAVLDMDSMDIWE